MTIYKCIKGFIDFDGDRARLGQEFIIYKPATTIDTMILQRKSGRGSTIHITKEQFDKHFKDATQDTHCVTQEVKTVTKKELQNEFSVGDSVMISKSSKYYGINDSNPVDIKGKVIISHKQDSMGFCYKVKWSNGRSNYYGRKDLVVYKEPKKELPVQKKEVVDDRLPVGYSVEITEDSPDSAELKKGDIVTILHHLPMNSYEVTGGRSIHKRYTKPVTPFKIGTKVEILIDNPNGAGLKKGDIVTIVGYYNEKIPSYKVMTSENTATWIVFHTSIEPIKQEEEIVTTTYAFKIGDRVKISKSSEWYGGGNNNPKDVEGKVYQIDPKGYREFYYKVKWDNSTSNEYRAKDLELVTVKKNKVCELLPVGTKVEILVDRPDDADLKKGDIVTISGHLGGGYDYRIGKWSISKNRCKEYIEPKKPEYYRFTEEFHQYLQDNSLLRVGKGLVAKEDQYECLIVIDNEYTPVIEEKNGIKLIKLVKKNQD